MIGKHYFRRLTGVFVAIVMIFDALLSFTVFAATGFDFKWETEQSMTDTLVLQNKSSANNVFLWWTFGKNNGLSFDVGTYTLSYNISDNKRVDFVVEKDVEVATVTYNVAIYDPAE